MQKLEQYFVAFWCLTMPITSFVLIPAVQGTILAYLMGLASIGFVLLRIRGGEVPVAVIRYFKMFAIVAGLWLLLICGSQFGDMLHPVNISGMYTTSAEDGLLFRSSMFTQSLYLLACLMIGLYFRYLLPEAWMKYIYWGAWFFVIYGLYDWAFFLVFHQSGDFIANRTFGGDHPGSWSQTLDFGGLSVLRLKSCLGEPSFVSVVALPYLFLAMEARKWLLTALLMACALLSTSTTVVFGLAISIFLKAIWSDRGRKTSIAIMVVLALAFVTLVVASPDMYNFLFADKLSGETSSGKQRLENIDEYMDLFSSFSVLNWIFGIGFGYLYFSLLWSITANTGLIGLIVFFYAFLKPGYLLPRSVGSEALKLSMVAIVIVVAITLTELFTPTTWMFLGLAYRRLDQLKAQGAVPVRNLPREESLTPALS